MSRGLFCVLFLLSGCVSYGEMKERSPSVVFQTEKAPDAYTACVSPKFMEIWPGMVSVIPDGERTVITVANAAGGTVTATVTITPENNGSHVALREMPHINLGNAYRRAQAAVESCR